MLLLTCPWCGARDETEYSYGGEAHIIRPPRPAELSDDQWADYLFMRSNPKGTHHERWVHSQGCRRWFNVERHTVSHVITAIYDIGKAPPKTAKLSKAPKSSKARK